MVNPSSTMAAVPVATVEVLNDLLDAELNSIFRFMGEGSPYLSRATAEVRRPLAEMVEASNRRAGELYALIETLGGTPVPRGLRPEEQYLAFLSLEFLLPKLVEAQKLMIRRYETAIKAVGSLNDGTPEAAATLQTHLNETKQQLATLQKAADQVAAAK